MNALGQTFVIVGAGLAGAQAAAALRGEGFDGRVVLIGDEPEDDRVNSADHGLSLNPCQSGFG